MSATSAQSIAAEIRRRVPGIGIKKLHKLLYYCQGHHLATFGRPLFVESISAWDMGHVVGKLWYSEKDHGTSSIGSIIDESILNTIGYVIARYGNLSAADLERLTHAEDPWIHANRDRPEHGSVWMQNSDIERFFKNNVADPDDNELDLTVRETWLRKVSPPRPTLTADTVDGIRARGRSLLLDNRR